jgi:hypothetical protein
VGAFRQALASSNAAPVVERRQIVFHKAKKPENAFTSLSKISKPSANAAAAPGAAAATAAEGKVRARLSCVTLMNGVALKVSVTSTGAVFMPLAGAL